MAKQKVNKRQVEADWDNYIKNYISCGGAALNETPEEKKNRIERLEKDFEEWKMYYFPKYCTSPAADFQKRASRRILRNPEWYECRVWSRELAKDVVCMIETLYQALTGVKKCIILISNSNDNADDLLKPYKLNLENNERIINDYGKQESSGNWKDGNFTTTKGVAFFGFGAGQSPRGKRQEEVRPDKVIISDIDTDENARNPDLIQDRWDWFEKAVYGTRSVSKATQYIWLNNLIAKDCCMARAMKMADKVDIVNLEDENGNSTWPEKNKQHHIERIKKNISTKAYQGEYMNNPLSEGDIFKEMTWGKVPRLDYFKFLIAYGDPAPSNSKNGKGSFKSIFLIGCRDSRFYVITGYLDHVTNAEYVEWYYGIRDFVGEKTQVYNYIENNTLQDPFYEQVFIPLFATAAKQKGIIGIVPDTRKKPDKFSRIEGNLEPKNRLGQLILNEKEKENPHMKRLEEQFKMLNAKMKFPADGPDCVEGGVWVANQKLTDLSDDNITIGRKAHNHKKRY